MSPFQICNTKQSCLLGFKVNFQYLFVSIENHRKFEQYTMKRIIYKCILVTNRSFILPNKSYRFFLRFLSFNITNIQYLFTCSVTVDLRPGSGSLPSSFILTRRQTLTAYVLHF